MRKDLYKLWFIVNSNPWDQENDFTGLADPNDIQQQQIKHNSRN
jgi:hypothetical protein